MPDSGKRDRIVVLLEHWDEIWDPRAGLSDRGGDGTGMTMMPGWTRQTGVQAVLDALRRLRDSDRHAYNHVSVFYGAETRIVVTRVRVRCPDRSYKLVAKRVAKRILPRGWDEDDEAELETAIDLLTELCKGTVQLPGELEDWITAPAAQTSQSTWLPV